VEFTCDATTFSTALAPLRACLTTPLPTGEVPLVTIETLQANQVVCRAQTMELEMTWVLEATIVRPGSVSVPGLPLLAFTREAVSGPLTVAVDDDGQVTVSGGPSTLRLKTCTQTIPHQTTPEEPAFATLPVGTLEQLLRRTAFCVSRDERRPALMGVLLRIAGSQLTAVATDGARLAEAMAFFGEGGSSNGTYHLPTDLLLTQRSVQAIETLLHAFSADAIVDLRLNDRMLHLQGPSAHLSTRLLTGTYPNYESVFAPHTERRLQVSRADLLQAIRQVSGLIGNGAITLAILDHAVTVTGTQNGDQARAILAASWDGPPTRLSCAPHALAEGLDAMDGESVTLAIAAPHAPIRCEAEESPGYRYVLLPATSGYPPA